jgi:hypothetical protein
MDGHFLSRENQYWLPTTALIDFRAGDSTADLSPQPRALPSSPSSGRHVALDGSCNGCVPSPKGLGMGWT